MRPLDQFRRIVFGVQEVLDQQVWRKLYVTFKKQGIRLSQNLNPLHAYREARGDQAILAIDDGHYETSPIRKDQNIRLCRWSEVLDQQLLQQQLLQPQYYQHARHVNLWADEDSC